MAVARMISVLVSDSCSHTGRGAALGAWVRGKLGRSAVREAGKADFLRCVDELPHL